MCYIINNLCYINGVVTMIEEIKAYLRTTVDEKAEIYMYDNNDVLPIYLREKYFLYKGKVLDKDIIFIEDRDKDITLNAIEKDIITFNKLLRISTAVIFKQFSEYKRKKLIGRRIPFLALDRQMFIPFLGLDLNEKIRKPEIKITNKFSSIAQLFFLYLLYNDIVISNKEIAVKMSYTKMSASRALNELYDKKLLTYEMKGKTNRKKCYRRIKDPLYYLNGQKYLKSPIKKSIYLYDEYNYINNSLNAGLSALTDISMINPHKYKTIAIDRKKVDEIQKHRIGKEDGFMRNPVVEIELWAYDPTLLSYTNNVDIVSLKLSLENENDDRVMYEIDKILKEKKWYRE